MSTCALCDLPTPDPPVTAPEADGEYCCRGCLEVAAALGDADRQPADDSAPVDPSALRERARSPSDGADSGADAVPPDCEQAFLGIDGMHCTTCEAFVELLGEAAEGVERVEVSYATELARVAYDPDVVDEADLADALSGYGYEARLDADPAHGRGDDDAVQRLLVGGFLAMLIMPWYVVALYPSYVGIETGILAVDETSGLGTYLPLAILGVLSTVVVGFTGAPVLRGAYVSLRTRRPNMDLLIATAALSAWTYSTVALAFGRTHLYYDVAVAVVLVVTLGRYYEGRIKERTTARLADATTAQVDEATRRTEAGTETVPVAALGPGDEVVVAAGERIPVDGTVVEGSATVDESLLTGESLPERREPGDAVVGGSVAHDPLVVAVGEDAESTLDRIAEALWSIQTARPGAQRLVDRLSTAFVPVVLSVAVGAGAYALLDGGSAAAALLTGLTVLVVSCPCAMGLATPLAVVAGLRDALERGVVVANETVFETAPDADAVVFDKTGTLTTGAMTVREVVGDHDALALAAALERRAEHPVADAVVAAVEGEAASGDDGSHDADATAEVGDTHRLVDATAPAPDAVESVERHAGAGVEGVVDGRRVVVGRIDLVPERLGDVPDALASAAEAATEAGDLAVVVGTEPATGGPDATLADGGVRRADDATESTPDAVDAASNAADPTRDATGSTPDAAASARSYAVAVVGDRERAAWRDAVEAVGDREVIVLTGDDGAAARTFAAHPDVDEVFAGVPPDGKVETIRRLAADRTVAMVGDGTNDAPALAAADLGIAMGSGTASAVEAADAVVIEDDLRAVATVFDLASGTRRRLRENVAWALCYNAVAIPLAAAGVINPLFAALAMATSSVLVVTNSRRSVV